MPFKDCCQSLTEAVILHRLKCFGNTSSKRYHLIQYFNLVLFGRMMKVSQRCIMQHMGKFILYIG